ncbi:hypothetical protein [Streptomyces sp. NPDC059631]|uniref:hypothetical protein n=1 Tax=unclassified Streptomyces TaxID=2593676 RepID=UPI0036C8C250
MDRIHPTDRADLTQYTRAAAPATFADVTNAAALAEKTLRTPDTPPASTARILARAHLAAARRLLNTQAALDTARAAIARHVAAADAGDDPAPADLLAALTAAGQPITSAELDAARAQHAAEAVTW